MDTRGYTWRETREHTASLTRAIAKLYEKLENVVNQVNKSLEREWRNLKNPSLEKVKIKQKDMYNVTLILETVYNNNIKINLKVAEPVRNRNYVYFKLKDIEFGTWDPTFDHDIDVAVMHLEDLMRYVTTILRMVDKLDTEVR